MVLEKNPPLVLVLFIEWSGLTCNRLHIRYVEFGYMLPT